MLANLIKFFKKSRLLLLPSFYKFIKLGMERLSNFSMITLIVSSIGKNKHSLGLKPYAFFFHMMLGED